MKDSEQKQAYSWYTLVAILCFVFATGYLSTNDFWQDELYTLQHFVFVPTQTTLTDYHSTNNHIAFSVLAKFYLFLLGIHTMADALQHPFSVRLLPFVISSATVLLFYFQTKRHYRKEFSQTATIVLCTTIVYVGFAVQLRGYALSIFLTVLQYFTILHIAKRKKPGVWLLILFLVNALNLLCLPTNIYVSLTLGVILLFLLNPRFARVVLASGISKSAVWMATLVIVLSTLFVMLYYWWLVSLQTEVPYIGSYTLLKPGNAMQALAIFYHFMDYRVYILLFPLLWVMSIKKAKDTYASLYFPALCFFLPYLFFFIHGAIIIQRTFLPLIPFFSLLVAAVVEESYKYRNWKFKKTYFHLFNIISIVISFFVLRSTIINDNHRSFHQQELRNQYYLFKFNASEASRIALQLTRQEKKRLYVNDDFGTTGLLFYLNTYNITYNLFTEAFRPVQGDVILTNNKRFIENQLLGQNITFRKLLSSDKQYNFYVITSRD